MARHHNRPTGKNAPGTAPAEKLLTEAEKRRVMEAGGAVTASALYGWLNARYPNVEVSPETKAEMVRLAADLSEAPGMLGAMARGALNGWMCQEFADMGARFAARAKAKEDAAPDMKRPIDADWIARAAKGSLRFDDDMPPAGRPPGKPRK